MCEKHPSNTDLSLLLYRRLNEQRLLTKFILFQNLKYRRTGGKRNTDLTGGHIRKSELIACAKQFNISVNTLRQRLSDFKKLGWMHKESNRYHLSNWRSIALQFTPEISKIKFHAKTKKELIDIISFQTINRNLRQQIFRRFSHIKKQALNRLAPALLKDADFSLSVRTLAQKVGYKAATTGMKLEKRLKELGQLLIIGRNEYICKVQEYGNFVKYHPELSNCCFVKGDEIFRRLCNNLIPVDNSKAAFGRMLLKKAGIVRKLGVS